MHEDQMTTFEVNVRLLAWERWPGLDWPTRLKLLGCPLGDLSADPPSPTLVREMEARFGLTGLRHADLLSERDVDVLRANLEHLLAKERYGSFRTIARQIGVSTATVSRWAAGTHTPHQPHLQALGRALSLQRDTDLHTSLLFLTDHPCTHEERRLNVLRWVNAAKPADLEALFPALDRLLGTRPIHHQE